MKRLDGKIALVTGANGALGSVVARMFAEQGADVLATDITVPPAPVDGVDFRHQDVTSEGDWAAVIGDLVAAKSRIDVLVNCAGGSLGSQATISDLSLDVWNRVIALNQTSVMLGIREVAPHMTRTGGGSIINFSSAMGLVGVARMAAYQTVKGAVRQITRNAAVTYRPAQIRVNSLHPGLIETALTARQEQHAHPFIVGNTPLGRAGDPQDVGYACIYLASDESKFVNGIELIVDGGYLAFGDGSQPPSTAPSA